MLHYAQKSLLCTPYVGFHTIVLVILCCNGIKAGIYGLDKPQVHSEPTRHISGISQLKAMRSDIKDCVMLTNQTTWSCFKQTTTRLFDKILTSDVVPIWNGIRLVRNKEKNSEEELFNSTSKSRNNEDVPLNGMIPSYQRQDLQHLTWFDRLSLSLAKTLTTHVLQINFKQLTDAYMQSLEKREATKNSPLTDQLGTARHRRHRYNMMITMMFGVTALGAVLIPLGFQMLSIVSGKALLLAKMALLLASINGLKKVANSGIHYGLYHVPGEHYGGYYDRGDLPHHPRNVPGIAVAQPVAAEIGFKK